MRVLSSRFLVFSLLAAPAVAHAADNAPPGFPNKPIRFITGFLPGGVSDTIARVSGDELAKQLGQRVIVDGRPGAGGMLSMEIAAGANPDGYTWYLGQPVITISPNFKRKPPFDPIAEFKAQSASWLERVLGNTGFAILRRVFGVILLAIAVKIFKDNVHIG